MNAEPVIITYNRSKELKKTLSAFAETRWNERTFFLLDNASTDDTEKVVESFKKIFKNLKYHRNNYNIGGNGNILRSVEFSSSEYHWVIGDDDLWHFNCDDELCRVLSEGKADIIRLGWLVDDASRGKYLPARKLAMSEKYFFSSLSMISATIVRRSIVTKYLPEAYQNISNAYPQLVPVLRATEEDNAIVYTLTGDYMTHTPNTEAGYFFGDLEWYAAWFRTARFLKNRHLKSKFLHEICRLMTRDRKGILKESTWLAKVAMNAKGLGVNQSPYLWAMLGDGKGTRTQVVLALLFYYALPMVTAKLLRRLYRKIAGLPQTEANFDQTRL